ncbi:hypothetical protein [Maribacter polysaccharolyticus]|uniref:hypothetical protein n=1 Tax=Maribacter polysaccharolyticus TaxID=3020831 RepID=UPI00237F46BB|nr:hypothetical protein [Maribacter polysaccharolyticus]MDE3740420.1 hypothetical protein [Maribacter polysaccharolyticus]MDE3740421.1 hypothetical protein [Maribacter polysaccharolyticus]
MKAIVTIIFIIFFGITAQAQNNTKEIQAETIEMTIATATDTKNEVKTETTTQVARLYKFKNSRVKKALSFSTKRNKAKMA